MEPLAVDLKRGAEMTGVSIQTLRRYLRSGALKASRIGRRIVIPVSELQKLVQTGTKTK